MLRSLKHYWRINAAVVAGAAVATAVLTGAVIVGDSMRASLRQLTLDRLGGIDWALVAEDPFGEALGARLVEAIGEPVGAAPALMLQASAAHAQTGALAADVDLLGVDGRFAAFFPEQEGDLVAGLERTRGQLFPSVVLNRSLARELDAATGDALLLSWEARGEIPRESLLGRSPDSSPLGGLRVTVTAIVPDRGPGRFGLTAHQETRFNAFVPLAELQRRLEAPGRANALFVGPIDAAALREAVDTSLRLDDLGLELRDIGGVHRLSSRRFVLRDETVATAVELFETLGQPTAPLLGYLANELRIADRTLPYSVIVGLDPPTAATLGSLADATGAPIVAIEDDDVVLGEWTALELGASVGDRLSIAYYVVGDADALESRSAELTVSAIARMDGLMADDRLLPDFPGIADADDIADWEPPFPMDLGRIRTADEQFWDRYRAAPKAFVNLATAQRLWASRFGKATTVRAGIPAGSGGELPGGALLKALDPSAFGLSFEPVKARGLEASAGATDFAGLFLGFSIFLIGSAGLVVGMLFRLSIELRAREVGLRRAIGFPARQVRRRLLAEGLALACLGGLLGTALAIAYAASLIGVLADFWQPILDLPLLVLELRPASLVGAGVASVLMVVATVVLTLRRLGPVPAPRLLAGVATLPETQRRRVAGRVSAVTLLAAIGALTAAVLSGAASSPVYFFTAGALLIVAGFAAFAHWTRQAPTSLAGVVPGIRTNLLLAARNSAHSPARSLLAVVLVGCATFMLVSIAANRRELRPETLGRDSGTGGFSLVAETAVPVQGALDRVDVQEALGLPESTRDALRDASVLPLRLLPGEDASCLNLYKPETPRVVGVTPEFVARGGFRFTATAASVANPWTLLDEPLEDEVVPAIGDANSVRWILHSGLGQEIELVDDHGQPVRLRFVALLDKSVFQSEVVVSEAAFLRHFPQHGGYSYFLLETDPGERESLGRALETELAGYGFDATATEEKLARFLGVEEMYLSTFQLLGGLGLVLGTVGLGVVLVRNVAERRAELAMLRAFGFGRRAIGVMIVLENAFQLFVGLTIGTIAGFLALAPYILDASLHLPWSSLGWTLALVVGVGLLSSVAGVAAALRSPLLPALKAD